MTLIPFMEFYKEIQDGDSKALNVAVGDRRVVLEEKEFTLSADSDTRVFVNVHPFLYYQTVIIAEDKAHVDYSVHEIFYERGSDIGTTIESTQEVILETGNAVKGCFNSKLRGVYGNRMSLRIKNRSNETQKYFITIRGIK